MFSDFETDGESDGTSNTAALWREEIRKRYEQESQFIAELRARNLGNGQDFDEKVISYLYSEIISLIITAGIKN